jgi:hypothetical protein
MTAKVRSGSRFTFVDASFDAGAVLAWRLAIAGVAARVYHAPNHFVAFARHVADTESAHGLAKHRSPEDLIRRDHLPVVDDDRAEGNVGP